MSRAFSVATLALLLAIGACGGEAEVSVETSTTSSSTSVSTAVPEQPDETPPTGGFDLLAGVPAPCTVVTAEDAAEILGNPVTAEVYYDTDCLYEPDGAGVGMQVAVYNAGEDLCAEYLSTSGAMPGETVAPVDGLGDVGQWVTRDGGGYATLAACVGGIYVSVQINGTGASTDEEMRAAADQVMASLLAAV
jgi:hypothetical protein